MSASVGNFTNNPAAAQAFSRFGFGGRPDEGAPADPVAWALAQTTCADQGPGGLSTRDALALAYATETAQLGSHRRDTLAAQLLASYQHEAQALLATAVSTKIPFRERLVWFWSNHFAVQADHGNYTQACAGPYVRDAIRPNLMGTLAEILQAAILHPAMLVTLNAVTSVGPQSQQAIAAAHHGVFLDINENLGRETLELYSLGYDQGYVQADVDALAYLLSGMDVNAGGNGRIGAFYNQSKQQPGSVTLMGTTYPCTQSGLASALQMLGTHPNTYLHLATKLVTHFVSDTPSQADIGTVVDAFTSTGGSLVAAHKAVVGLKNAWVPLQKLKAPAELLVSAMRALGTDAHGMPDNLFGTADTLGQPIWCSGFPTGWPDLAIDWNGPAAMMLRTDWAWHLAGMISGITPTQALQASVAPFLSATTSAALAAASTEKQQFALLFSSPEFQRR